MINKDNNYTRNERVLLSEVLPYELPIIFSNRHVYNFLLNHKIKLATNGESSNILIQEINNSDELQSVLQLLYTKKIDSVSNFQKRKIPFNFRITHKEKDFRELTLIHPINQLVLIEFYNKYESSILYHCNLSNYSIRKPHSVATRFIMNNSLQEDNYPHIRRYFTLNKYNYIHRFYTDYKFINAEKKFKTLLKFDISKCFDSIYTHSIAWATLGLEAVKENVDESKTSFAGKFDTIMQYSNYGETNGLVIGPEVSRIFAEIILQRIDKNVETRIARELKLQLKSDYQIFRYVDDYFLFVDNQNDQEEIMKIVKQELKKYKLSINDSKYEQISRPMVTNLTSAKLEIKELFDNKIPKFQIDKDVVISNHISISTEIKTITKNYQIDYKDISNYTLLLLNKRINQAVKIALRMIDFQIEKLSNLQVGNDKVLEELITLDERICSYISNILEITFFIYSVSPRVTTTIKCVEILSDIIDFFKEKTEVDLYNCEMKQNYKTSKRSREKIYNLIYTECSKILNRNKFDKYTQLESLYILCILKELGPNYRLPEKQLARYFCFNFGGNDNEKFSIEKCTFNYFTICVLLYYVGNKVQYTAIKSALRKYIIDYIKEVPFEKRRKSSELTHLIMDIFTCPFLDEDYKLSVYLVFQNSEDENTISEDTQDFNKILRFSVKQRYWFIKWSNVNLNLELKAKSSIEAYT